MLYIDRVTINYFDLFHLPNSECDFYSKETKTQYLYVLILNNWKRSIFEGSSLHQLTRVSLRRCVIVLKDATRPTLARPAFNWQLKVPPSWLYPTADKNDDARILPTTRRRLLSSGCHFDARHFQVPWQGSSLQRNALAQSADDTSY